MTLRRCRVPTALLPISLALGLATAAPPAAAAEARQKAVQGAELDAETCADACALLTRFPWDQLVTDACKLCEEHDDTFCTLDFPFSDVPSCEAYDELRNCIYARFGYVFSSPRWQKRFEKAPWYKPDPAFTEAKLPPVAKANVEKLKQLKAAKHGCR